MEKQKKRQSGITLIALVITIIVLLILAGVSISLVVGDNGVLTQAQNAVTRTNEAQAREQVEMALASAQVEYLQKKTTNVSVKAEDSFSKEKLNEYISGNGSITDVKYNNGISTLTYNGDTYYFNNQGNLVFTNKEVIGEVTVGETAEDGNKMYIDANKETAIIPQGFTVSGFDDEKTIADGLVIYDLGDDAESVNWVESDKEKYNQFVWVPCSGAEGRTTYETELAKTWKANYSEKQSNYTNYSDWTDNGGNSTSVNKYGGFYIGRYEAGVPSNADFYANSDGVAYNTSRDVITYTPVSRKNNQSWNFISQTNAKIVSSNMYSSSTSVASSLVDSYAWDTVIKWYANTAINEEEITNSSSWGNCTNNTTITDVTNSLFAVHKVIGGLTIASTYSKGSVTPKDIISADGAKRVELATGATEKTKRKNIYDMAGNTIEWTTETGNHNRNE